MTRCDVKIEYMRLNNFKAFQDAELKDLPNFCVFVGANGSGKSTIFSVFGWQSPDSTSTFLFRE